MTKRTKAKPIRGNIRTVGYYRVAHGLFRLATDGDPDSEFRKDLEAWTLVLPEGAVFTHVTAARLLGWQLPKLPEQVPVFAAVGQKELRPRRPGLICSRITRSGKTRRVDGLLVDAAEEILLRAARDLGLLDLLIMVDSARRLGAVKESRMRRVLESRRPGVRNLRAAWALSTPQSQSAGETTLRLFDEALDVGVEPQVELRGPEGELLGIADLLVSGTQILHEYDGAHHRRGSQHRSDLRRDRGLSAAGYQRRGFTLDDLLNQPATTMHEIDRDLHRSHDPDRLQRWRTVLGHSLYTETGRRRVMNRWQRQMGITEWSEPA